ncbi:MAG: hypothetical protein EON89_00805 [Brevundimonas sp.]|nr:MAG: hypothetical protein EON89_00805 [Brevundimonas sp.]
MELRYSRADLEAAPRHHRLAFLGLAQVANESSLLLRLALASVNSMEGNQAVRDSAQAGALFAVRMLAGHVSESRLFVDTLEVSSAFRELREWALEEHPDIGELLDTAVAGRTALAAAIPKRGLIRRLRHEASFHVDPELIEASYARLPADMEMVDHHAVEVGNSIFGAAETLHLTALAHILGEADVQVALNEAQNQISDAVGHLGDFINGFSVAFSLRYLGLRPGMPGIEVESELLTDIKFPLFIHGPE